MNPRRLRLALKPSPLLASAIFVLHSFAAASALAALPGLPGALIAAALASLGAIAAWRRALLGGRDAVTALEIEGPKLAVYLASGDTFDAEVAPRRYVGRYMVILPLTWHALRPVRRTILLTPGMLGGDLFRRMRIWALWSRLPAVAAKQLPA